MSRLLRFLSRDRPERLQTRVGELGAIEHGAELTQKVTIGGRSLWTLEQAAHAVRQYSINHGDHEGWRLARQLREANDPLLARLAEARLRTWIRLRMS